MNTNIYSTTPLLSIVIISFNTHEMTRSCLESIYSKNISFPFEVIIIDNHSTDGSVDMIKRDFRQVYLVNNAENKGFAAANNQAFKICSGEYILLLNSDTLVIDNVLEDSVAYLEDNRKIGAMGCRVLNADGSVQHTCSGYPSLMRLFIMTLAIDRIPGLAFIDHYFMHNWKRNSERQVEVISGCFLMIRREIIRDIGLLDEDFFFFGEETDWCHRIRAAGWLLYFAPVGEIIHHGGGSVKKLNYKRDVMLTAATVRLHWKHDGFLGALLAYFILMFFNLSRAFFWSVIRVFSSSAITRSDHFKNVVLSYRECWPRKERP